jgi:hypothetical protein
MQNSLNGKRQKTIGIIALFGITAYLFLNTAFLHCHQMPDGRLVVHSHYVHHTEGQDEPDRKHSHSESEFLYISILSKIDFDKIFFSSFSFFRSLFLYLSTNSFLIFPHNTYHHFFSLRGPPFLLMVS